MVDAGDDLVAEARRVIEPNRYLTLATAWTAERVTADARHRLYRARVQRLWVLDEHDERLPVDLSGD